MNPQQGVVQSLQDLISMPFVEKATRVWSLLMCPHIVNNLSGFESDYYYRCLKWVRVGDDHYSTLVIVMALLASRRMTHGRLRPTSPNPIKNHLLEFLWRGNARRKVRKMCLHSLKSMCAYKIATCSDVRESVWEGLVGDYMLPEEIKQYIVLDWWSEIIDAIKRSK